MNLEWQQIATQIVGFLLLVWVMKKFAWKPLLGMLEERRQKIVDEFKKIEDARDEVARMRADFEARLEHIEDLAREKENAAIAEGRRVAAEIQAKAREDAHDILDKARQNIELEIAKAKVDLRNQIVGIAVQTTEKVLKEELTEARQRQKIESCIDEIGQMR